jgi:hypothetical protein
MLLGDGLLCPPVVAAPRKKEGKGGKSGPLGVLFATNDIGRARRSRLRDHDASVNRAGSALPSDKVAVGQDRRFARRPFSSRLPQQSDVIDPPLRKVPIKQHRAHKAFAQTFRNKRISEMVRLGGWPVPGVPKNISTVPSIDRERKSPP